MRWRFPGTVEEPGTRSRFSAVLAPAGTGRRWARAHGRMRPALRGAAGLGVRVASAASPFPVMRKGFRGGGLTRVLGCRV